MIITELPKCLVDLIKPESYREYRKALVRFFMQHGASDAYDLADEVILRLLRNEVEIKDFKSFLYGIAANVLKEDIRRTLRERGLAASASIDVNDHDSPENRLDSLERCLKLLDKNERTLIESFYKYAEGTKVAHRVKLAKKWGLSDNALRVKVSRIRKRLTKCMSEKPETSSDL